MRMSNVVLTATGLRRVFGRRNKVVAVDGVNLDVEPGQVHALLGPNGAGKTTTVRMCSTLLAPTSGDIAVDGDVPTRGCEESGAHAHRRRLARAVGTQKCVNLPRFDVEVDAVDGDDLVPPPEDPAQTRGRKNHIAHPHDTTSPLVAPRTSAAISSAIRSASAFMISTFS